jgi:hypothetical protein
VVMTQFFGFQVIHGHYASILNTVEKRTLTEIKDAAAGLCESDNRRSGGVRYSTHPLRVLPDCTLAKGIPVTATIPAGANTENLWVDSSFWMYGTWSHRSRWCVFLPRRTA